MEILSSKWVEAEKPGQKWISDSTNIRTGEGWRRPLPLYLTATPERAIVDLADRQVVGWALSDTLKAVDTSIAAWPMAFKNRLLNGELLFHRSGDPYLIGRDQFAAERKSNNDERADA